MTDKAKKRPGRPRKAASLKGETFSVRLAPALRLSLEQAAAKSGRSLTGEISFRLQRSLMQDSPAAAKRQLAIKEIRDAGNTVVLMSEIDDRTEIDEKILHDSLEDLGLWLRQLQKLDEEEERSQRAAMEKFNAELQSIGEMLRKGPGKPTKGFME